MTTAAERVFKDALALSDEEREELVAALTQTLPPSVELDAARKAELARRVAEIESGEAMLLDAEIHVEQLRVKFE
ncbi:MAG: addiction module protein [Enhygromyxa sp.]